MTDPETPSPAPITRKAFDRLTAPLAAQHVVSPAQGVAVDRYEFSVFDSDDQEMAGGDAATFAEVVAEGRNYLRQYNQDGPHRLELRRVLVLDYLDTNNDHA